MSDKDLEMEFQMSCKMIWVEEEENSGKNIKRWNIMEIILESIVLTGLGMWLDMGSEEMFGIKVRKSYIGDSERKLS